MATDEIFSQDSVRDVGAAVANEDYTITINVNGGTEARNSIGATGNWNALFRVCLPFRSTASSSIAMTSCRTTK